MVTAVARAVVTLMLCAGGVTACGDDEAVGGTLDSGLAGDRRLDELTTDEALDLCGAALEYSATVLPESLVLKGECVLVSLISGGLDFDRAQCEAEVAECLQAPHESSTLLTCDLLVSTVPGCGATVSQLESCIGAAARLSRGFLEEISCNVEGLPELYQRFDLPPPECDGLAELCPELVPGATL